MKIKIDNSLNKTCYEIVRPNTHADFVGRHNFISDNGALSLNPASRCLASLILWRPTETGKTSFAKILAKQKRYDLSEFSGIRSGVVDIRSSLEKAKKKSNLSTKIILFLDEVYRYSKLQQDLFLPHIESGLIVFIKQNLLLLRSRKGKRKFNKEKGDD